MKTFFTISLLVTTFWANAQITPVALKTQLMNLVKAKHDFERVSYATKLDSAPSKDKYLVALNDMIKNRDSIITAIDQLLITDSVSLNEAKLPYVWINPVSSYFDYKNLISHSYYFKIVKYCLEKKMSALPRLKDVPF